MQETEIIRTNLSVDEALKMVVSAGRMSPQEVSDKLFVRQDKGGADVLQDGDGEDGSSAAG